MENQVMLFTNVQRDVHATHDMFVTNPQPEESKNKHV